MNQIPLNSSYLLAKVLQVILNLNIHKYFKAKILLIKKDTSLDKKLYKLLIEKIEIIPFTE